VTSALQVRDLDVSYGGVAAVRGVTIDVAPGVCVALVGANGAGKTSTLRAIGGLIRCGARARVSLDGRQIQRMPPADRARARLGHVLEGRHVFSALSVRHNLELGAMAARGRAAGFQLDQVLDLLPELRPLMDRPAAALSGGQQQLLAIGRALAGGPIVLMLDEPSNGLAPILVDRVVTIVREIRDQGVAVLLVEQRLEIAQAVGDEVHILQHGQIIHSTRGDDPELPGLVHAAYLN
jgi:branched-chain amino acid transport system ATP-binding protein